MPKKKLSQRLFSALVSLLLHGKPLSRSSSSSNNNTALLHPSLVHKSSFSSPPMEKLAAQTLVLDVEGSLLRSPSLFPYFMLVALEAGGFLRGLVLLLLYPLICCMGNDMALKVLAMVSFCGLRVNRFRAGRAVLPKWFLEDVGEEGFDVMRSAMRRVCVTKMPRVMVEGFLKEYLEAEVVIGREMKVVLGFFTGLMEEEEEGGDQEEVLLEEKKMAVDVVGFSSSLEFFQHHLSHCCKEVYMVTREEKGRWSALPRHKYPKPMVFHDGRLAFRPTAGNALAMFTWLPFGVALGAARLVVSLAVPYRYSTPILAATGMSWRLKGARPPLAGGGAAGRRRGQLFVCNHRTLIDPVYVSVALDRPVRAVSYSLSRLSELISPIGRTVRLTRDRDSDGRVMARLLDGGDLVVVCPEGTTCREPYLLRFSPLFAELSDDVVPVGTAVDTSTFYATTAGGLKCFDPLYYIVNPRTCYTVQFLAKVDTTAARERRMPSTDMANLVQRKMGDALGYGCTMLTRKDKYLMLAGNDGVVKTEDQNKHPAVSAPGKKKQ
ncbi:probable glycerol-3-phosphate acyltransferase 3 [Oryza brachyantha]|uniref:probable glycerol-3-phosphate acyltransferase 3 n=1 Tax=Oryza brachyantha TaxID=4533 RepID=UPI001ADC1C58|nr:probable glycerol-3-phosphate acyltransferase 3 [Oryza brachyantha]